MPVLTLWLKPSGSEPVFTKDRAGMFVMLEDDHFNVLHVTPGSPAERAGLKNSSVRQGDLYDLPIANDSFDVIILHQVLHFLDDGGRAIRAYFEAVSSDIAEAVIG